MGDSKAFYKMADLCLKELKFNIMFIVEKANLIDLTDSLEHEFNFEVIVNQ